ncbi:MAG: hypothetical protein GY793_05265 [Proteobacteria bacterium]|nr:hypothetical protein [Pseudomonadota bacterium]
MIDYSMTYDKEFCKMLANARKEYADKHYYCPDIVYISSDWAENIEYNENSEYFGKEKLLGMEFVYMASYGLNDIMVGSTQRKPKKGLGSPVFRGIK